MKRLKMLGAAAVGTVALSGLILVASASAGGVLCSAQETPCAMAKKWPVATNLDFTLKPGTAFVLTETGGETLDQCNGSTIKSKVLFNPDGQEEATNENTEFKVTQCVLATNGAGGKIKISNIAGGFNGTVHVDEEIQIGVNTILFGICNYGLLPGAHLGVLGEGKGAEATLTVNAVMTKTANSSLVCPATARWRAEYVLTEPNNTTLAVSPG
jgi:hypothetical protein